MYPEWRYMEGQEVQSTFPKTINQVNKPEEKNHTSSFVFNDFLSAIHIILEVTMKHFQYFATVWIRV